jgi:hypothetical protein
MADDTTTPTGTPPTTEAIRLRAAWLCGLGEDEREALVTVPLRQVDALFAVWLDVRGLVGQHGGG